MSNCKVPALSPILLPLDIHVLHLCPGGTLGTPLYCFFDLHAVALEERLHPAIVEVSDPASETQFVRNLPRESPKKNPLNLSAEKDMRPCRCHGFSHCRVKEYFSGGGYGEKPFKAIPADVDDPQKNIPSTPMKCAFLIPIDFQY